MIEQPAEEKIQSSLDIEHILNNVVNRQIADYMNKFGATIERKLGHTEDDLINDMREQIWKGLLTHKKGGQANLKTYLNTIIKNRFLVLYEQSTLRKYNSVDYHADAFSATGVSSEFTETEDNGETLLSKRQEFMNDLVSLTEKERMIFKDLILGFNLNEMVKRNKIALPDVIGAIKRIDETMRQRRLAGE